MVLQGAGAHFCSGGAAHSDAAMPRVAPGLAADLSAVVEDMRGCVTMLRDLSAPVLSVLHGKLTGGGVALALNTDWRGCTSAAKFNHGNLPRNHSPIGGFGMSFGVTLGPGKATMSFLSDLMLEGEQALSNGLVDLLALDVPSARHRTRECAGVVYLGCHGAKQPVNSHYASTESVMNATSALDGASLAAVEHSSCLPNTSDSTRFVTGLAGLGQHEILEVVESMVQTQVHEVIPGTSMSAEDSLMESGVDSLAATELLVSIQRQLGQAAKLSSTVAFDYPTVKEIAAHIVCALQPQHETQHTQLTPQAVLDMVLSKVSAVVSSAHVGADDPLMESGVDSLAATELQNSLQRELGTAVKLPSTLVFDSPTSAEIAQFVVSQLLPESTVVKTSSHHELATLAKCNDLQVSGQCCNQPGVSIVAMQGKTPAVLCQTSSTWVSLACAHDTTATIPSCRFEQDAACGPLHGHFVNGHHSLKAYRLAACARCENLCWLCRC